MPNLKKDTIPELHALSEQELLRIYNAQSELFNTGTTRSVAFRKEQLKKLRSAIIKYDAAILEALHKDLRKSAYESFGSEIGQVIKELDFVLSNLDRWSKPKSVPTPLMFLPSSSKIHRDPLGTVLIISPWNYPFLLSIAPLINAIAGGNTAFIKPSEEAPFTAKLMEEMISEIFDASYVKVVQGLGHEVIPVLMHAMRFDHVFFTGSTMVGQKIMEMAAKQLIPVTLELGGKSPCIVDQSANLKYAAKKIAWSKLMNAGQTCIAPDYILVHSSVKEELVSLIKSNIKNMFGEDPSMSTDLGRIINTKRFNKLITYLSEGKNIFGGAHDVSDLYIQPTLLDDVKADDSVMKEEIFGPILPIIAFEEHEEALNWIKKNPFPLSLYIYAEDKKIQDLYLHSVRFGGACVNNGLIHIGNPHLPFGGVGASGTGQYHGLSGFETFTRPKSVMYSKSWFDVPIWYAPFKNNVALLRKIFKFT